MKDFEHGLVRVVAKDGSVWWVRPEHVEAAKHNVGFDVNAPVESILIPKKNVKKN